MSKPIIFIIGATGSIGAATVTALSSKYADKVDIRAGVRSLEKADKIRNLPGVQVVQATMGDEKLSETLQGVDTLYVVTPSTKNRAELTIATAEQAKKAGVKHIGVVSVASADKFTTDIIIGHQFVEIEKKVSELGVPYIFIRLPSFYENYWGFKDTIKGEGAIYSPIDPEKPFTAVAAEDAGKASAEILVNPTKYANKTLTIVSDRHSYNDVVTVFGDVLKKEIKHVQVPYEATKQALIGKGVEEWQVTVILQFYKMIDAGDPAIVEADFGLYKQITGEDPTDLKTWVTKNAVGFQ